MHLHYDFDIGTPFNLVALANAETTLQVLKVGTNYNLTKNQEVQALQVVKSIQHNSSTTLLDVIEALDKIQILQGFATAARAGFLPS